MWAEGAVTESPTETEEGEAATSSLLPQQGTAFPPSHAMKKETGVTARGSTEETAVRGRHLVHDTGGLLLGHSTGHLEIAALQDMGGHRLYGSIYVKCPE